MNLHLEVTDYGERIEDDTLFAREWISIEIMDIVGEVKDRPNSHAQKLLRDRELFQNQKRVPCRNS